MTVSSETLRSISTPDQLESRLGTLDFIDGVPSPGTVELVYDHLDYVHALNVFLNGYAGASTVALRKGLAEAGAADNQVLIFSELMDSASLFLTANADTAYFLSMVDLRPGPMVVETPPQALGMFTDRWWQWIVDFGLLGPVAARAAGSCSSHRAMTARSRQRLPRPTLAHDESVLARPGVLGGDDDQGDEEREPVMNRHFRPQMLAGKEEVA